MADLKILNFISGVPQIPGDISIPIDSAGWFSDEPTLIEGTEKVNQDVSKAMLTTLGSNYLASNYGTTLRSLIRGRKLSDTSDQISSEIQRMLGYIAEFNKDQPTSEQLAELIELIAEDTTDGVTVTAKIRTGDGATVTVIT